ncbi:MAG: NUDIX domain-containing protein [Candidatus Levybacteria bacterium]|nr:NUDIX domain-containing protein [Candidatus Levybacteria bacterium]
MRFEFSAGGIVYKKNPSASSGPAKIKILVAQHSQHHGWVFPKGLIGDNPSTGSGRRETKKEAALREVEEETGVIGKIIKPLVPVTYWYVFEKEKIKKTVYYFLMKYVSGDISKHDMEMENVEWIDLSEVEKKLTYKSDKQVWQETKKQLATNR